MGQPPGVFGDRAPSGHEGDRRVRGERLERPSDLQAVHPRHPEVGHHEIDRAALKQPDGFFPRSGQEHLVTSFGQNIMEGAAHRDLIINHEDPTRRPAGDFGGPHLIQRGQQRRIDGKPEGDGGALPHGALNRDLAGVPGENAVHDAHPEPASLPFFGGEKGIEDPMLHLRAHPAARIDDRREDRLLRRPGLHGDRPPRGQRVQRVEEEVDEDLTKLGGVSENQRKLLKLAPDLQRHSEPLGIVPPATLGEIEDLPNHLVEVERGELLRPSRSIEVLKAADGRGAVFGRLHDQLHVVADRRIFRVKLEEVGLPHNGREDIIELMSDPRRHLSQGAEPVMLDQLLLHPLPLLHQFPEEAGAGRPDHLHPRRGLADERLAHAGESGGFHQDLGTQWKQRLKIRKDREAALEGEREARGGRIGIGHAHHLDPLAVEKNPEKGSPAFPCPDQTQPDFRGRRAHQNFSHLTDLRSRPLAMRTSRTFLITSPLPET